jgi:hypothetical protein
LVQVREPFLKRRDGMKDRRLGRREGDVRGVEPFDLGQKIADFPGSRE